MCVCAYVQASAALCASTYTAVIMPIKTGHICAVRSLQRLLFWHVVCLFDTPIRHILFCSLTLIYLNSKSACFMFFKLKILPAFQLQAVLYIIVTPVCQNYSQRFEWKASRHTLVSTNAYNNIFFILHPSKILCIYNCIKYFL